MSKKPTVLMTLSGRRLNGNYRHNAVYEDKTPVMNQLMSQCLFVKGEANGMTMGLPEGQMGSSGTGHLNIGAGRIVYQELTRITKSIQDEDFFRIPEFIAAAENCRKHSSALHVFGLVSDGGIHSRNIRIYGLLELAKKNGLKEVYMHCFLDGRDTPPESGKSFVEQLEAKVKEVDIGEVAPVMGRYCAMDRDKRWGRAEQAYNTLTKGEENQAESTAAGIQASHDNDKADKFVIPLAVMRDDKPVATTQDKDSVIFYDFRPDRARGITRAFYDDSFDDFPRKKRLNLVYVYFAGYDETIQNRLVVFKKESITNTFDEFLTAHKKTQVRVMETEKYTHVTFFSNGGVEEPNEGEDRILVPSSKEVITCDLRPEVNANGVCDKLVEAIKSGRCDVTIINFANPGMIGHAGVEDAAIKVIETVDACVGRAVRAVKEMDGVTFICAGHGNTEQLVNYEAGEPFIARITNPAPFILVNADPSYELHEGGALCDIVPTLVELMGMEWPKEMAETSLLVR